LLTREIVAESDLILVMAPSHLSRVKELEPGSNVHMLSSFASGNDEGHAVQDPFGGDLTAYRDAFEEIEQALSGLLDKIPAT
jgi:protein-tyrosine-phosphatase